MLSMRGENKPTDNFAELKVGRASVSGRVQGGVCAPAGIEIRELDAHSLKVLPFSCCSVQHAVQSGERRIIVSEKIFGGKKKVLLDGAEVLRGIIDSISTGTKSSGR